MNVIVTGASGFVGTNLVNFLSDSGFQVEAVSLRDAHWKESLKNKGTAIIHLAGKAHDTSNTSFPEDYFKVNRDLTIALFDHFLQSSIRDFFFFSSVKAVADTLDVILTEDYAAAPSTPYGRSKREAEEYLLDQLLPAGKRLFIIRPCMVHGPGNKGNLNLLFNLVGKGFPWPLASFENRRSFISVDNLSYLVRQMILADNLSSGVYNFADDNTLSTNALVSLIGKCMGKSTRLLFLPVGLITGVAKIGDVLPIPLNSERLKKLTESYAVSNDKIKRALKIEKLPLAIEDGLGKTIQSFLKSK